MRSGFGLFRDKMPTPEKAIQLAATGIGLVSVGMLSWNTQQRMIAMQNAERRQAERDQLDMQLRRLYNQPLLTPGNMALDMGSHAAEATSAPKPR